MNKKNINALSLTALALSMSTPAMAQLSDKCGAYVNRQAGSNPTTGYDGGGVAILTANQIITTSLSLLQLSTAEKVFPFASLWLRGFTEEKTNAPDAELVGCLQEFDQRVSTLEEYNLFGEAKIEINNNRNYIKTKIIDQSDYSAHKEGYRKYDAVAEKLGGTINYFLNATSGRSGNKYRAIKNDAVVAMLHSKILAFAHNLEYNAYCAQRGGYAWNNNAINMMATPSAANYGQMDYAAMKVAADQSWASEDLMTWRNNRSGCELGRDAYSRFKNLLAERVGTSTVAEALANLGLTITLRPDSNFLSVSIDNVGASKLYQYRKSVVGQCHTRFRHFQSGKNRHGSFIIGTRVWASAEDYGPASSVKFNVSDMEGTGRYKSKVDQLRRECESWRNQRFNVAYGEVRAYLNSIKTMLESISLVDYIRPVNELAGKATPFKTYNINSIHPEFPQGYMLVPQYTADLSGDISGNFNTYQIKHTPSNQYLKHSYAMGVTTSTDGSSTDSHWLFSQSWPGGAKQIKNRSTGQCLKVNDGQLSATDCGNQSAQWDTRSLVGDPSASPVTLSSTMHTGRCLALDGPIRNLSRLIATNCNSNNATQQFQAGPNDTLKVGSLCLDVFQANAAVGEKVISYGCHGGLNQKWMLKNNGLVQSFMNNSKGEALCLEVDGSGNNLTLQICNSNQVRQKFTRPATPLKSQLVLHKSTFEGQCLVANGGTVTTGTCSKTNSNQQFTLAQHNSIKINGQCLEYSNGNLSAQNCHYGSSQAWELNNDGGIQAQGTAQCLEPTKINNVISFDLQTCSSTNPAQRIIRKAI